MVNTALNDQAGWITDISRKGLQLHGVDVPQRAQIAIHYRGKYIEGTVRWSHPERGVGIALNQPLQDGPLAQVWQRFQENVAAFGGHARLAKAVFGRKA